MTVFAHLEYELLLSKSLELLLNILRKEVIQPQVPLRLPCYDFTPVTDLTVACCLQKVSTQSSGKTNSHGVTGGVCTRPGNVFTASCCYAITSDSDFMPSSCRRQSELRHLLGINPL